MAHVAITGASSGIGEALVREYARAGYAVTMVARRRELLEALAKEVGGKTHLVAADLSDEAHALDWLAPAEAALGPIDVLVNNAGVQYVEPTAEVDVARARALLDLDLVVPMALQSTLLPQMLARKSGTIINVSSLAAIAPLPGMFHYNAAKGGLAAASESLRAELRRTGVHVLTVYPGPVDTPLARKGYAALPSSWQVRLMPEGTTDVLARRIRRAAERRRSRVIYPRFYHLARWLPTLNRILIDLLSPLPYSRLERERRKALPGK
jgi:short-subunit dehydrogenase